MNAIVIHRFGPPENLRFEEVPDPEPGPGEVRIAVHASGVHLVDATIRSGQATSAFPLELPAVPGREVAGVVDAVGEGVSGDLVGRRVVAHLGTRNGGYAELAVVAAASLHEIPDHLAAEAAVAMIGTGRTTLAILELAEIAADDVVLVTGAAGGIGSLLVQAARSAGATVVGAAAGETKVEAVRSLGAGLAVDYGAAGWGDVVRRATGGGVTLVLDGVGGDLGRSAFDLLVPGGRLVMFGWASGDHMPLSAPDLYTAGVTVSAAIGPRLLQRPGGMGDLEAAALAAAASGSLVPVVGAPFALPDAADAHRAMENRTAIGKTVLLP